MYFALRYLLNVGAQPEGECLALCWPCAASDARPPGAADNLAEADQGAAELDNETDGTGDDENRNKRFLPFNLNGAAAGGGSGGGSGNFLFDIIRVSGAAPGQGQGRGWPSRSRLTAGRAASESNGDGRSPISPRPLLQTQSSSGASQVLNLRLLIH